MYTVIRVYANGDRVRLTFASAQETQEHLDYSIKARFGCAHFKNGKCVSQGYLTKEQCDAIEEELSK